MDFIVSHGTRSAGLPFSDAVRVGDILCLSGQIGHRPGTLELVPGGIAAETRQMMENIARILNAAGRSFDDVFKCTVMLADMSRMGGIQQSLSRIFQTGAAARAFRFRCERACAWCGGGNGMLGLGGRARRGHNTELTSARLAG